MKNRFYNQDDWQTPKWFYDELDALYHFDFDPCPLEFDFDGLLCEWGQCNFVNPPYSFHKKEAFVEKAVEEQAKGRTSVFLLPVSTSTKLFHEIIIPKAQVVRFLYKRIPFIGVNSHGEYVNWHLESLSGVPAPEGVVHVKASGQQDSMLVVFEGRKTWSTVTAANILDKSAPGSA